MAGEEKTEHIPAIFEIGLLLNGNQLFSPGEKKTGRGLGVNPYLSLVPRLTLRFYGEEKSYPSWSGVRQTTTKILDEEIKNTYCADLKCNIY